jgi:intracellular septation protein A
MSVEAALVGLLPLIVFAIVDLFASLNVAIAAAIVMGGLEALWCWYRFGEIDQMTWISLGLIVAMGLISMRMQDARLFKFQPVVLALLFAATLGWFQWHGDPLLLKMLPKVVTLLPPDQAWMASDDVVIKRMARLDLYLIGAFIAHGALVSWFALRQSTFHWVLSRAVGFYLFAGLALVLNLVLPLK